MSSYENAKILLIAPPFFGYAKEIASELTRMGALVDYLPDRPFEMSIFKAMTRLNRELVVPFANRFYKSALERIGKTDYSSVLVIVGETLSPTILLHMRALLPDAEFILYMWDSFANRKSLHKNLDYFDRALTFDLNDANSFGMEFRPLFFSTGCTPSNTCKSTFDMSFIGTAHSDRFKIVNEICSTLGPTVNQFLYLYLQAPWVYYAHKLGNPAFRSAKISQFKFTPLDKAKVHNVFLNSASVLDIEHPKQTGLTMRTFETLGAQKKLITTNRAIEQYDFYSSNNILVIDRKRPCKIPEGFFKEPYEAIDPVLYAKYSVNGWLNDVLNKL